MQLAVCNQVGVRTDGGARWKWGRQLQLLPLPLVLFQFTREFQAYSERFALPKVKSMSQACPATLLNWTLELLKGMLWSWELLKLLVDKGGKVQI